MSKKDVQALAEKLGIEIQDTNGKNKTVKELNEAIDKRQAKAEDKPAKKGPDTAEEKPAVKVDIKTATPQPTRKMIEVDGKEVEHYYQGFYTKLAAAKRQAKHIEKTERRFVIIEEEQKEFFHVWKTYVEYKK